MGEADLISAMDSHGIGTDATIHQHIKTIFDRKYVKMDKKYIVPTPLGRALVEAHMEIGTELYLPTERAAMENDLKAIAKG